ncbi:hypothetical protein UF75_4202 [Desulfosporosinus sp. I2]|nr:hypothetical protein UF75_4202 [Desulfosporosinus sp. I2]
MDFIDRRLLNKACRKIIFTGCHTTLIYLRVWGNPLAHISTPVRMIFPGGVRQIANCLASRYDTVCRQLIQSSIPHVSLDSCHNSIHKCKKARAIMAIIFLSPSSLLSIGRKCYLLVQMKCPRIPLYGED